MTKLMGRYMLRLTPAFLALGPFEVDVDFIPTLVEFSYTSPLNTFESTNHPKLITFMIKSVKINPSSSQANTIREGA